MQKLPVTEAKEETHHYTIPFIHFSLVHIFIPFSLRSVLFSCIFDHMFEAVVALRSQDQNYVSSPCFPHTCKHSTKLSLGLITCRVLYEGCSVWAPYYVFLFFLHYTSLGSRNFPQHIAFRHPKYVHFPKSEHPDCVSLWCWCRLQYMPCASQWKGGFLHQQAQTQESWCGTWHMGTCWQNWQATKVPYTLLPSVEMGTSLHQVIQIIQACGGGWGGQTPCSSWVLSQGHYHYVNNMYHIYTNLVHHQI